jgi:nitric oxide reductase NorE protein
MMWVLIASELLAFGGFFIAFAASYAGEPALFRAGQAQLDRRLGVLNTFVLLTSGLFAALAVRARHDGDLRATRGWLALAASLGFVFLGVKAAEYADKIAHGLAITSDPFFELYYLLTGFHALHVAAGIVILAIVAWRCSSDNVETGAAFWHMVDLVWVLLFPIVYLLR